MSTARIRRTSFSLVGAALLAAALGAAGCSSTASSLLTSLFGQPFPIVGSGGGVTVPGSTGTTPGGATGGAAGTADPCDETQARKFIRISMRNASPDFIHYFLLLIAEVNGVEYPTGAVCADDIPLYTSFGYTLIPAGSEREFGNFCIVGPALFYFHRGGQFRGAGAQGLGSAIAPAQGSSATFDGFFGTNGAQVPVPNRIIFHNPGTTSEGLALKVAFSSTTPCVPGSDLLVDPACLQDGFYYVDENGFRAGSTVLGTGSYVRVPSEIQGTGCQCGLGNEPASSLAPPGTLPANAQCDQFFRGGRIDFAFVREDTEPPFPQLVWRVSDVSGTRIHDFDPRANIR